VGDSGVRQPTAARGRLIIDLDAGTVATGGHEVTGVYGPEAVLAEYLDLVYLLRDVEPGSPIPMRKLDLEVLARELTWREEEIERELHELMLDSAARHRPATVPAGPRRWLLGIVALVVLALALGGVALAQSRRGERPSTPSPSDVAPSVVAPSVGAPSVGAPSVGAPSGVAPAEINGAVAYERDPVTGEIREVEPGE
jgi:hypothetical protein